MFLFKYLSLSPPEDSGGIHMDDKTEIHIPSDRFCLSGGQLLIVSFLWHQFCCTTYCGTTVEMHFS